MKVPATAIESELENLQELPTPVASWQVETGTDATEEPSVWVWVMLEHEDVDRGTRASLRDIVRNAVRRRDATSWVYVRFRGARQST